MAWGYFKKDKVRERKKKKKEKEKKKEGGLGEDGSPAPTANRTSSVMTAGHPHRRRRRRPAAYLSTRAHRAPGAEDYHKDKCCVFPPDVCGATPHHVASFGNLVYT